MDTPKLNPGSNEALAAGCRCPVLDNSHGLGVVGLGDKFGWVVNSDCPMHGEGTATWAMWQED